MGAQFGKNGLYRITYTEYKKVRLEQTVSEAILMSLISSPEISKVNRSKHSF